MVKSNVLFLCTGNSARSQMAEAFARKYAGERFNVFSAGLEPKGVHPLTVRVMNEIGVDMRDHYSKDVKEFMGRNHYRYVITVCSHAEKNCPAALWASAFNKLHWSFEDPAATTGSEDEKLAKFREIRDQIDQKIQDWLAEMES
ncbi:MAG: arsenate reductase ArsC [Anaerolineae bacterium]|nr:arsenate reductase ArsC [Anaerolineae bacterium]